MQQPPEPPRNFLPEVPLRSLSEHPGECWGCCESRVENPKRHGWNKRQHKREVTAAIIDHNFSDPTITTNKAHPQIRKSFQKRPGTCWQTSCDHLRPSTSRPRRLNQLQAVQGFLCFEMFLEHEFNQKRKPVQYWLWFFDWDPPPRIPPWSLFDKGSDQKWNANTLGLPVLPCDHLYNLHGLSWESSCACSFLRPFLLILRAI